MKKILFTLALISLLAATGSKTMSYAKHPDYVPDEQTAIKIAEAVWLGIYGNSIYEARPFTAHLSNNIWHVHGTKPDSSFGGVPMIDIRKSDCNVSNVVYSK
jgi:hypothetical protein